MNEQPLPPRLKRITVIALVMTGLLGVRSAQGITSLFDGLPATAPDMSSLPPIPGFEQHPELIQAAFKDSLSAQRAGYESMQGSRLVILMGLWGTSALAFVSALRLLKPKGTRRENVRQLFATTLLISTVLRTLDGAQVAAVAHRAGRAIDRVLAKSPDLPGGWHDGMLANAYAGISSLWSFLVIGTLVLLVRYFRSESVRMQVADLDVSAS